MEVKEGKIRDARDIIFTKVGPDLPALHTGFNTIPAQALAVSNKFGLTFFVHSTGFSVARTADLVQAAVELKDSQKDVCNAQEKSLVNVSLPDIRILAVSKDELTIATCAENKFYLYDVPTLVHKMDRVPLESRSVPEETGIIQEFIWNPTKDDSFITLSSGGSLISGQVGTDPKTIAKGVEAADWSPDGQHVGYITRERHLHIAKSDFSSDSSSKLPSEMFGEDSDGGTEAHVDTLKWVRLDSMLISCVHIDADVQEDECPLFLLVSSKGHLAKEQTEMFSFDRFFTSTDVSIVPIGNGPYMLASHVRPWDVTIVTSRRSIDDHIALLVWLQEDGKMETYKFDLVDDKYIPRIELQASDEDNSVVGLAIDLTTLSIRLPAPGDDSGAKLPPCPLLLCMTLEGKLSLFSFARTDEKCRNMEIVSTPLELPESRLVSHSHEVLDTLDGDMHLGTPAARLDETEESQVANDSASVRRTGDEQVIASGDIKRDQPISERKDFFPTAATKPVEQVCVLNFAETEPHQEDDASAQSVPVSRPDDTGHSQVGKDWGSLHQTGDEQVISRRETETQQPRSEQNDMLPTSFPKPLEQARVFNVAKKEQHGEDDASAQSVPDGRRDETEDSQVAKDSGSVFETGHNQEILHRETKIEQPRSEQKDLFPTASLKPVDQAFGLNFAKAEPHEEGDASAQSVCDAGPDETEASHDVKDSASVPETGVNQEISSRGKQIEQPRSEQKGTSSTSSKPVDQECVFNFAKTKPYEQDDASPQSAPARSLLERFTTTSVDNTKPMTKTTVLPKEQSQMPLSGKIALATPITRQGKSVFPGVAALNKESASSISLSTSKSLAPQFSPIQSFQTGPHPVAAVSKSVSNLGQTQKGPAASSLMRNAASSTSFVQGNNEEDNNAFLSSSRYAGSRNATSSWSALSKSVPGVSSSIPPQSATTSIPRASDFSVRPFGTSEQKQVRASGVSEMEADFVKELEEVRTIAKEVDDLMAFIEGRSSERKVEQKRAFTKSMLEDIESGIQKLSEDCKHFQKKLQEQRQSISDLGDQSMQVDAWRIYVQSLVEQASDSRYRDLWNKQRLHPEMDVKRKRILKVDQVLKQQIAELEEHLHNLELSRWQRSHDYSKRCANSALLSAEKFQSLQSLYGTVNTQMAIAEQLVHCLTQQMETLKISSTSQGKTTELIDTSATKLRGMAFEEKGVTRSSTLMDRSKGTPQKREDLSPSRTPTNYVLQTPAKSDMVAGPNLGLQDSTRRRRDSMDKSWVDVGAAKTTVKRAAPARHLGGNRTSPNTQSKENVMSQLRHSSGQYEAQSSSPPGQISFSNVRDPFAGAPAAVPEKMLARTIQAGRGRVFGKTGIGTLFSGEPEHATSSAQTTALPASMTTREIRHKTTHGVIQSTSRTSSSLSSPNFAVDSVNTFASVSSFPQPSGNLFSKAGISCNFESSTLAPSGPQANINLSSKIQTSGSVDSVFEPPVFSTAGFSKLGLGPSVSHPWVPLKGQPGIPSSALETKEEKETKSLTVSSGFGIPSSALETKEGKETKSLTVSSGLHSTPNLTTPRDLQVGATKARVVELPNVENNNIDISKMQQQTAGTSGKLETQGRTDSAALFKAGLVPFSSSTQASLSLKASPSASALSSPFSTETSESATLLGGYYSVKQDINTRSTLSTSGGSTGLTSGVIAETVTSPVVSPFLAGSSQNTASSGLPGSPFKSQGASMSSVASPFGSVSSLFSSSISNSTSATTEAISSPSRFEAASFRSGSSMAMPSASAFGAVSAPSMSSTFKPASYFGQGMASSPQQVFPPVASSSVSSSAFSFQGPPTTNDEDEMEEEMSGTNESAFSGFGGFGLGSSAPSSGSQKANPFGGSLLGSQSSSPSSLSIPSGQLFRPAAFSLPTAQSSPQQSSGNMFGSGFTSGGGSGFGSGGSGFGSPAQPTSSCFGQPAQPGQGQQALGSALGAFGQTRQLGTPFGSSMSPSTGFGFATSGGFASTATGGGFASAATGGGFASAATGGGFASAATGGGFAGVSAGGGFQSFSGNQGGFGAFAGGSAGFGGSTNSSIFTQMRK